MDPNTPIYQALLAQPDSEGQVEMMLKLMYQEQLRKTKELELEILKLQLKNSRPNSKSNLEVTSQESKTVDRQEVCVETSITKADMTVGKSVTHNIHDQPTVSNEYSSLESLNSVCEMYGNDPCHMDLHRLMSLQNDPLVGMGSCDPNLVQDMTVFTPQHTPIHHQASDDHSIQLFDFDFAALFGDQSNHSNLALHNGSMPDGSMPNEALPNQLMLIESDNYSNTSQSIFESRALAETQKKLIIESQSNQSQSNQAKKKTKNFKKKYLEQCVVCFKCKRDKAHFLLHCTTKCSSNNDVLSSYGIDFMCVDCLKLEQPKSTQKFMNVVVQNVPNSLSKRKRSKENENEITCTVCKEFVGKGGFRNINFVRCDEEISCTGHLKSIDMTSLEVSGHKTEVVCIKCSFKYRFCTECGGGGKFRTGKYRPAELFVSNRKTCSLSHVRLSGSKVHIKVFSVPDEITDHILEQIHDVHMDGYYGLYAIPDIMETCCSALRTFKNIKTWGEYTWQKAKGLLVDECKDKTVKYLATAFMEKTDSNRKSGWRKSKESTLKSSVSNDDHEIQIAYASAEWDMEAGCLFCANGYVRATSAATLHILHKLDVALIERARNDWKKKPDEYPPIEYIWILVHKEHSRLQAYAQKMGFTLLEDFEKNHGDSVCIGGKHVFHTSRLFARNVHVPLQHYKTFVAQIDKFLFASSSQTDLNFKSEF